MNRKRKSTSKGRGQSPSRKRPVKPPRKSEVKPPRGRRAHRLGADVRPQNVDLHLELDPAKDKAFKGAVALELHLERQRRSIELHAAELRVSRARLETEGGALRGKI